MYTTIQNLGGSHGIRIPEALLEAIGLRENDRVILSCQNEAITISKPEEPNNKTRAALGEVREMKAHPKHYKGYRSFATLLMEVREDAGY